MEVLYYCGFIVLGMLLSRLRELIILSLADHLAHETQDSTCVGTLGPTISDEFNSLNDVSWYGIA
jgi:hypothetical protein